MTLLEHSFHWLTHTWQSGAFDHIKARREYAQPASEGTVGPTDMILQKVVYLQTTGYKCSCN